MEVAEVLFPDPALLPNPDYPLPGKSPADLAEGGARALVRGDVKVDLPVPGGAMIRDNELDVGAGPVGLLDPMRRQWEKLVVILMGLAIITGCQHSSLKFGELGKMKRNGIGLGDRPTAG
nr:hypothetical protein MtrunA17_Chr1g0191421 [Ipomoea batatas]